MDCSPHASSLPVGSLTKSSDEGGETSIKLQPGTVSDIPNILEMIPSGTGPSGSDTSATCLWEKGKKKGPLTAF